MTINSISFEQLFSGNLSLPSMQSIHTFLFSIKDYSLLSEYMDNLPEAEKIRACELNIQKDRQRFLAGRVLLRRFLSQYLGAPADTFIFKKSEHGKPYLDTDSSGNTCPSIYFNLSHSGDYVALAFSQDSPIGIDIENIRENARIDALVKRFFHPDEYTQFTLLSDHEKQAFLFQRWTVREAFLKGIGSGLTISPRSFYLEEISETSEDNHLFSVKKSQEDYSSWRVMTLPSPDGYYCSIAYQIPE